MGGVVFSAWSYSFSAVNEGKTIYYNILSGNAEVTYNTGYNSYSGAIIIPATVTNPSTSVTYDVTTIGSSAFKDCVGLTSITIPSSISKINSGAFAGCLGLSNIIYNATTCTDPYSAVFSDSEAERLTITIGDNVTKLPSYLFCNLTNIQSVTIPSSVTSIGTQTFSGCSGLTSITIPSSVTSIGQQAFQNCISLKQINYNATSCADFTSSSGKQPFNGCTGVNLIVIGDNVTTVPAYAFYGLTSVKTIIIGSSVTTLKSNVFYNCTGLTEIWSIPTTPPNCDGYGQFSYIPNTTKLYVPSTSVSSYTSATRWNTANFINNKTGFTSFTSGDLSSLDNPATIDAAITVNSNTAINQSIMINSGSITINNGYTLTATSTNTITNPTAANLIIEDGGQIILPEDASVNATVKRSVTGSSKGDAVWEAFASTINNPAIGSTNLITGTYDLYMYDESADKEWVNYKAHTSYFANLTNSRGYLYRNATTMDITIEGALNTSDISDYTLSRSGDPSIIGFNFVGNPYQMDIYKGVAISNTYLETGYYVLDGGAWSVRDDDVAIAPGAGILVQANSTGDGKKLDVTYTNASAKANHDNIMFTVANSEYSDIAYAMFDEGHGLNKISHRNQDVPMLYIPQNDENFAIAMMSDDTKAFDLNFKAMTTGKYTLSCKTKGNFRYLHIIDRLTGEDVDMLLEDEYSFIGSKNDNENRFIVRLEYSENPAGFESSTFAWQNGSDIIVTGEGELQVFDVMGRRVSTMRVSGETTITAPSMHGVYIFKLNDKTQKIVVK